MILQSSQAVADTFNLVYPHVEFVERPFSHPYSEKHNLDYELQSPAGFDFVKGGCTVTFDSHATNMRRLSWYWKKPCFHGHDATAGGDDKRLARMVISTPHFKETVWFIISAISRYEWDEHLTKRQKSKFIMLAGRGSSIDRWFLSSTSKFLEHTLEKFSEDDLVDESMIISKLLLT